MTRFCTRKTFIIGAALTALMTAGGSQAQASAGCDAVNAGGFNFTVTITAPPFTVVAAPSISGFAVGDAISFTLTASGAKVLLWALSSGNSTVLDTATVIASSQARSYTVTGNNQDTTLVSGILGGGSTGTVTVSATCTPSASNSNKLRALQIATTKMVAEASGSAISNAVGGGIDGAFSSGPLLNVGPNGITFNFAA